MIGQKISHYEVLEKIGAGGMGEVYLAEDTKLKRQVALKFLPRQMTADPEAKERFEREAQAAAALNHPNIVTIHEIGEHNGQIYIAMEYVEGQTLKDMISGSVGAYDYTPLPITHHQLPITQVIEIATQLTSGLAAAHAKGIVHRDIKPQNILVDKNNHVKILDFGLAKLKGVSSLTKESSTLGTVHYMSPEQTMGRDVDQRSDIWSLGVVLYEMLTGKLPFKGDYEQAVIYSILNEEPKKASEIRQDIPPELDRMLEKALAKEPEDRYQHVDDLLVDLKHLRRDSRPDRQPVPAASRRNQRRWTRWGFPAAILLAAFAIVLFFITTDKPKPDVSSEPTASHPVKAAWTHSIAVLPFKNLSDSREDEYFSDGVTEDIIAQLSKIGDLKVISRTSVMRFKGTSKSVPEIGRELNVGAVLEGSVRRSGDQVRIVAQLIDARDEGHLWAETYDHEMKHIFSVQSDVAQKIASALQAKLSPGEKERIAKKQTVNPEAYQLYLRGRYHWNRRMEKDNIKAIAYFEQALEKDPRYALAHAGLASTYVLFPAFGFPPKESYRKAQEAASKALEIDPDLAEALTVLASISENHFEWARAENEYRRAIELDPGYPTAHQWYSQMLCTLGRPVEGLVHARRAVELDPLSLIINLILGRNLYCLRRYDQAIDQYRKTVELDTNWPWGYYEIGVVLEAQGRWEEAINEYQAALRLANEKFAIMGDLGRCYARAGRREDALEALRVLREYSKKGYAVSFSIADVYYGLGDIDQAFPWYDKAIEGYETGISTITDPQYDGLRSDPRYAALMKKVGLQK